MAERKYEPKYTVSALAAQVKAALEARFGKIYVEAEISGWRVYPSGHAYFTLKDAGAQVSAVMFASNLARCRVKDALKDGAKVLVYGTVSLYPSRGSCQMVVLAAKLLGAGDLMQRYLELKAKLEAEGLFDPGRKRPLPFLPRRIGIVTSEAGAVIHDMCTVLTRRFPAGLEICLYPSLVQGAEAPRTLLAGLAYFARARPDLVIVARGGGSFEDLFCFNDEALVRAVAASPVPVISAVGHETDYTLCDFAADRRAGTPSIAAELAVPVRAELEAALKVQAGRLRTALQGRYEGFSQRVDHLSDGLASALHLSVSRVESRFSQARVRLLPAMQQAVAQADARLGRAQARLLPAARLALAQAAARLAQAESKLGLLSPYGVLSRGYALVTDAQGAVVRSASAVLPGSALSVRLAEGVLSVVADG